MLEVKRSKYIISDLMLLNFPEGKNQSLSFFRKTFSSSDASLSSFSSSRCHCRSTLACDHTFCSLQRSLQASWESDLVNVWPRSIWCKDDTPISVYRAGKQASTSTQVWYKRVQYRKSRSVSLLGTPTQQYGSVWNKITAARCDICQ